MSDALTRDEEMLARLAELDLMAAEKVHGKLMAAEETAEIADLGRTYQRMSRSLRQTLALKSRLRRERADDTARATILGRRETFNREMRLEQRTRELQDALERVAAAAIPDVDDREDLLDRFDVELDDWIETEDYLTADLDTLLLRACRQLDLPEDLVPEWRDLPRPGVDFEFPEDDQQPDATSTAPPIRDSA